MWHAVTFSIFLLLSAEAQYFSEGGGNAWMPKPQNAQPADSLTNIVDELRALRNFQQQQQQELPYEDGLDQQAAYDPQFFAEQQPQYFENEVSEFENAQELAKIGADLQKLLKEQQDVKVSAGQPEQQEPSEQAEKQEPVDPKKRGQFEFVEFVEPHAKALKNVEHLDKRAPISEISGEQGSMSMLYGTSNVMFIVAMTLCSVFVVAGVVGGAYHLNNIRKQRNEAFDDFTRYSPAGPGRDVLRKGRQFAGSPITDYSSGDDVLTKAAHLHHYEQTKQKIIGSDNGINNDDHSDKSDDEADDLEEHNFSIYECPGLAMSGDIEVKNPNFEQQNP